MIGRLRLEGPRDLSDVVQGHKEAQASSVDTQPICVRQEHRDGGDIKGVSQKGVSRDGRAEGRTSFSPE